MLDLSQLASEYEDLVNERDEAEADGDTIDDYDVNRIKIIEALADDLGYTTIQDAVSDSIDLIEEGEFKDHARQLAEDLLGVNVNEWPMTCIDWERAAADIQVDYTSIEFAGDTFYMRST